MSSTKGKSPLNFFHNLPKKERWTFLFIWFISALLIVYFVLDIYFYSFYQRPSVTWEETVMPLVSTTIKKGDPIEVLVKRCSKQNYSATVSREVIDSIIYTIPPVNINFLKGCVTEVRFVPEVSYALPVGVYHINSRIEISIRWFIFSRKDVYQTSTDNFTIVP